MKLTMPETKAVRIDKFLWSVRIYKTRTIATEACKKGRIIINDIQVKPSRIISAGEIIVVKKPPVSFTFRVIEPVENRVGAKLAGNYVEDLTPEEEKQKLEFKNAGFSGYREKGTGRPTKKERRDLDNFFDGFDDF
ncbi:MAG TPA: RNA-binding S4 domain-containing protein [Bacteroidales bacterium]|jgi:ribosome-associated heat shock protein Hsp15|nr:RNA-binding S4 domain-containing protein [Bacteroidales bacterium]